MRPGSDKFLYFGCERQGHENHPLNQVCLDMRCDNHELVCSVCISTLHEHHQTISIIRLLDQLHDFRFSSASVHKHSESKLKQIRRSMAESLSELKKIFEATIKRLEDSLHHYDKAQEELSKLYVTQPLMFYYDINQGVEATNGNLKRVVPAYLQTQSQSKARRQAEAAILSKIEQETEAATKFVHPLAEMITTTVDQMLEVFKRKSVLAWSTTLKHPLVVLDEHSGVTKNTFDGASSLVLVDCPLDKLMFNCQLRITDKNIWIGLGVVSGQLARKIGFKTQLQAGSGEIRNLCMVYSGGGPGANGKPLTKGYPFLFEKGDSIRVQIDQQTSEVRFEKSEGEWCISTLEPLSNKLDRYYIFAIIGKGDRVEIVQ